MNFERPYYIDIGMRPMLFYIIFGVNDPNTVISRERHRVDAAPEGLEFQLLNREQHGDYIDSLLSSVYGEVLREKKPELFDRVKECSGWTILRGELSEDSSLDYLRNTIGFVQAFCEGIQSGAPIDSFAAPEPWDMPGYDSKVIMSAGAFTSGSSIELSADAPLREPFAVWMQGGLNFASGKVGVMLAADEIVRRDLL